MSVIESNELIKKENISTKYGFYAGLGIAVILFLFQLEGDDFNPYLKLWALLPLALFILIDYNKVRSEAYSSFPAAVFSGLKVSFVAALTVVAANVILFLLTNDYAFSKYGILPESGSNFLVISAILFFEIFVFGGIMSFIAMQMMKGSSKNE